LDRYRKLFVKVVRAVRSHLGPRPFHLYTGFNAAAYDAVFVALADVAYDEVPRDLKARYEKLVKSEDFRDQTTAGTTDVDVVKKRIALAKAALTN